MIKITPVPIPGGWGEFSDQYTGQIPYLSVIFNPYQAVLCSKLIVRHK